MKEQFDHELVSSFYIWLENQLLSNRVSAYQTGLANTYSYVDAFDIPEGFVAYQGAYRQLVAEANVDSPNSGIFVNSNFVALSNSGVYTDYNNGRIIFPLASGSNLNISSTSTVKEVNTYLTNDNSEQTLLEGDFREYGETYPKSQSKTEKHDEKIYFLPACFITPSVSDNKELAFGGEEDTQTRIRVMVLAYDNFTLDGILSCFRDSARKCIPMIDYEDYPYGAFGSLKSFPYRYNDLVVGSTYNTYIEKVTASRVLGQSFKDKLDKNIRIGFLDFDLSTFRFPRL